VRGPLSLLEELAAEEEEAKNDAFFSVLDLLEELATVDLAAEEEAKNDAFFSVLDYSMLGVNPDLYVPCDLPDVAAAVEELVVVEELVEKFLFLWLEPELNRKNRNQIR
jgi:hypothetical protein